ncbi:MAG: PQQ-binding-like beta-propeller repeat protein [Candidatus Aenigmarchaeota archaeon]|nr:PQQ-binding-like beta-propeller repeat protein [Candidatus Aenigmarchaeota archaeon]
MDLGFGEVQSSEFETEMTDLVVEKPQFYSVSWDVGFGGSISNCGVIKNNIIYFGACDEYIYAVDLNTGKGLWKYKASGRFVEARPSLYENNYYHGCYDGYMYKLDIREGKLVWKFKTGDRITSQATLNNGILYFSSFDGNVYAIDDKTGKEVWRFKTGNWVGTGPLIYKSILYVGSGDGYLYALTMDGKEKWRFKTGGAILHYRPAPHKDGIMYFPSSDRNLYAVNMETGKEIWRFKTGDRTEVSPLIHEDVIYFGAHDNNFYALDAKTGKEIWRFRAKNFVGDIHPIIHNNAIYFGSVDGNLYALSKKDGNVIWKFKTGASIWADAVYWNDMIIFGSYDCYMYSLNANTGKEIWRFPTSTKVQSVLEIREQIIVKPELKNSGLSVDDKSESYFSKTEEAKLETYGIGSEYSTVVSDYKQKSQYDIDVNMVENSQEEGMSWISHSRDLNPQILKQK